MQDQYDPWLRIGSSDNWIGGHRRQGGALRREHTGDKQYRSSNETQTDAYKKRNDIQ